MRLMCLSISAPGSKKARNRGCSGDVGVPNRLEVAVVGAHVAVSGGPAGTVATWTCSSTNAHTSPSGDAAGTSHSRSSFVTPTVATMPGIGDGHVPSFPWPPSWPPTTAVRGPSSARFGKDSGEVRPLLVMDDPRNRTSRGNRGFRGTSGDKALDRRDPFPL